MKDCCHHWCLFLARHPTLRPIYLEFKRTGVGRSGVRLNIAVMGCIETHDQGLMAPPDACYLHGTVLEDMSILNLEGVPVQVRGSIRCSKYSGDGIYWGRMIKDCWDRCVLAALPRLGATCVSSVGSVLKFINKLVSKPLWSQIKNASNPQPSSSTASAVEWSGLLVCFSSVIVEFNFALLATHLFRHFVSAIVGLLSLLC